MKANATATKKVSSIERLQGAMPSQAVPLIQVNHRGQNMTSQSHVINATVEHQTEHQTEHQIETQKKHWWHSISHSSRYSSHLFLGSGLVFMERFERLAEPVVFLWKNLGVLCKAISYLTIPAISSILLLWLMPSLAKHVHQLSWFSVAYMIGFYIANAFGLLLVGFISRALFKGFRSNLDALAERGREAFSTSKEKEVPAPSAVIEPGVKPSPYSPHHFKH